MSDLLIELGANKQARSVIQALGLPLPMPQKLRRAKGGFALRPLEGRVTVVGAAPGGELSDALARTLTEAGATLHLDVDPDASWTFASEAWSRPLHRLAPDEAVDGTHALVFDATGIRTVDDLVALHAFFQPRMRSLARCGRVVVLSRPPMPGDGVELRSVRRGLDGFVRSLSKEVGATGSTANLLQVEPGAEVLIAGPLRFFLSEHSAFITGQPLRLSPSLAPTPVVPWTRSLEGCHVLVTGAARGIGAATAEVLAREGARVLCLDRPDDAALLAEVAHRVGGVPVLADVTSPDAADAVLAALGEGHDLYGIVHNAGITRDKTLRNMDRARWDLTLAVNTKALLRLTTALRPRLAVGGRIVALSSVAGLAGNFGQTNYSLSKAAVVGFVEALSEELADRAITVNGIAPGFIETRLTAAIPVATREGGRRLSALVQGGLPVDIAEAVTFLCTSGAAGVQGRILRVCGGALIGA